MLVKTGLLVISNPNRLGVILPQIKHEIESTLYIQVLNALREPFGNFYPNMFSSWPKFSHLIHGIYTQATKHCQNLDVRVLLSGLKYQNMLIYTEREVELVIFDEKYALDEMQKFLSTKLVNISKDYKIMTCANIAAEPVSTDPEQKNDKVYQHTVLGGTFDRLHVAHKLLLSEAALRSNSKITVGVTEENMIKSKILWELIEPLGTRMNTVENFLKDICPELNISVVSIEDPFGPTQHDPTIDLLVVSKETIKGGEKVNEVRKNKGLPLLDLVAVDLIDEPTQNPYEEKKVSSNTQRMRLLGTLLKPVKPNLNLPKRPYIIGLTGGIATGKSNIAKRLEELGAFIIDCDKIAHGVYKKGKPCHALLVKEFGEKILDTNGEIDRKVLGPIVFSDPAKLDKLNSLVWPALADEVNDIIKSSSSDVVIVEAAILIKAGWEDMCHEIWSSIVAPEEAIKRIAQRNNLTPEQAKQRIDAQPPNKDYVEAANVVFCSFWPEDFTRSQVDKAWDLLKKRLP